MDRIAKLKEFLVSSPGDCFLLHALALEYVKLGDDAQGEQLFLEVLQQDASYVGTYLHLALLLQRKGDPGAARHFYEKGIEVAKQANDRKAQNELQQALDDLD